jgi:hypothetical protein
VAKVQIVRRNLKDFMEKEYEKKRDEENKAYLGWEIEGYSEDQIQDDRGGFSHKSNVKRGSQLEEVEGNSEYSYYDEDDEANENHGATSASMMYKNDPALKHLELEMKVQLRMEYEFERLDADL